LSLGETDHTAAFVRVHAFLLVLPAAGEPKGFDADSTPVEAEARAG